MPLFSQTHKVYGDQHHEIEDAEFARDIHEYYKHDRKVLLNGRKCEYFFFGVNSRKKMSSKRFSALFASSMQEAVGKRITPQVTSTHFIGLY